MITIEIAGKQYTKYESVSVTKQLDALCNSFSITVATANGEPLPFKGNEPCTIWVDDVKVLTGWLEDIDGSHSSDAHTLSFNGRDRACDIVDSSLEAFDDIGAQPSLKQLIEIVLKKLGLDLKVIEDTKTRLFNKAEDSVAIESGDNAFEFLQTLSNKRQVLLSTDGDSNIHILQAKPKDSGAKLFNLLNSKSGSVKNNIVSASWSYSTSGRFGKYISSSKLNPTALNFSGGADLPSVVGQSGRALDKQVRESRQMVFKADKSSSSAELTERCKWEANIRRSRSMTYNCSVSGHTIEPLSGTVWDTNTLVFIQDDFAGIEAYMLLNKITFKTSLADGDTAELEFVDRDAYTTELKEPKEKKTGKQGAGLFDPLLKDKQGKK